MTARQREVAALVLKGLSSKQIARILHISPQTVAVHRRAILHAYGVHSVTGLATVLRMAPPTLSELFNSMPPLDIL
ncbi:LuxR C-terminal-related transcriptional regulator [Massilia sp. MB5]|uniref:LuxR C-terminal-related transcriptional regulator n=1 Tax=Massilia sp. MB5 TaxID=2919578 RepID=UPI0035A28C1F